MAARFVPVLALVMAPLAVAVVGCSTSAGSTGRAAPSDRRPQPSDEPGASTRGGVVAGYGPLPPLDLDADYVALPVPDHRPAIVSIPRGARSPRPVIVATHGAGGRPDYQCEWWRRIVENRAFVLCLTGKAMYPYEPSGWTGYFYTGHPALGREMSAAFAALREQFDLYVDPEAPVFAGYSQGAIMGALLLPAHPLRFARAVLIEGGFGGYQEWNVAVARRFAEHGGQRVLLACGRKRCAERAQKTAQYLEMGGLQARVVYARGAGHTYYGPMEREIRDAFGWIVSGDERF